MPSLKTLAIYAAVALVVAIWIAPRVKTALKIV